MGVNKNNDKVEGSSIQISTLLYKYDNPNEKGHSFRLVNNNYLQSGSQIVIVSIRGLA